MLELVIRACFVVCPKCKHRLHVTTQKAPAYVAYDTISEKAKISTGKKIDAIMARTRVALFHLDTPQVGTAAFVLLVVVVVVGIRLAPVPGVVSYSRAHRQMIVQARCH